MIDPDAALAIAPVAGLGGFVVFQVLFSWLTRGRKTFAGIVLGFALGMAVTEAGSLWAIESAGAADFWAGLAMNAITFGALGFGYFALVNLNVCSVRIRLLEELRTAARPLSAEQLLACYDSGEMIEKRLARLTGTGQLLLRDGRLYSRPSIMLLGAHVMRLTRFCILGSVEPRRQ